VHVYADGVGQAFLASESRPDVANAFGGYGAAHGFDFVVPVPAGGLCAYAFNLLQGTASPLLGCPALSSDPFGSFDLTYVDGSGDRHAAGWAIDPNTDQPIAVHVWVADEVRGVTASNARPDVGDLYPLYGDAHGFDVVIPFGARACAYAINVQAGAPNVLLGCRG
jgi:hypothetical protein